ncbi:SigE family RNA polymerase sigma factor [Streptomyces sp. C]|uniref:SigE family RNA polymerase sigma factor n=1 Tax=Streptomyces sp. C TaxID=253839 RepID=UPI0001B57176|nr:SigE family RNA polymerase sigma factor [Streptomyces sp. C]EFL13326.1 RNA polymerase ECF-subfamily sigma factor [Streptomyces sp. C]
MTYTELASGAELPGGGAPSRTDSGARRPGHCPPPGGHEWQEDFTAYVRMRRPALLRTARRLVPDPADAEDLVQAALLRTHVRWDGIADKSLADGYLRRVMISVRTDWWRARRTDEVPMERPPELPGEDGTVQLLDRAELLEVLTVLSTKQRAVVVLRYWAELSIEETAGALGVSPGTVKSTLHRALLVLRQELTGREAAA